MESCVVTVQDYSRDTCLTASTQNKLTCISTSETNTTQLKIHDALKYLKKIVQQGKVRDEPWAIIEALLYWVGPEHREFVLSCDSTLFRSK